jgi:probable phosphoglycerate mutase
LDETLGKRPDWQLFRDGARGGESPAQIEERADYGVKRVRAVPGNVLLFSSGHFIRVLTASWLGARFGVYGQVFSIAPGEPN